METLDHVERELDPETLLIADPAGPLGIAGVMGGSTSEVSAATTDVIVESAIFDPVSIRRTAFRYAPALRGEPPVREGPGASTRAARGGSDRPAHRGMGRRHGRERRDRHEPDGAAAGARAVPTGAGQPAAGRGRSGRGAACPAVARRRGDRAGTRRHARASWPAARSRSRWTPPRPRPSWRPSRPGVATSRSRRTSPRKSRGSAATSSSRTSCRDTPMPPYRPSPLRLRDAVREVLAGAGLSEAVSFALVSPAMVERFPAVDDPSSPGRAPPAVGRSRSRIRCRASTPSCASG